MTKTIAPIAFLLALCAVAFAHAQRDKVKISVHSLDAMLKSAPAAEHARPNPYTGAAQAALAGRKLFRRHCAECHGDAAQGTDRAPTLHSPRTRNATPGDLNWFLFNGNLRAGMPSWSALPEQRRWQIVTYLKSSQEK